MFQLDRSRATVQGGAEQGRERVLPAHAREVGGFAQQPWTRLTETQVGRFLYCLCTMSDLLFHFLA